jgi:hypothetical protein
MTATMLDTVALNYLGAAVVAGAAINNNSTIIDTAGYDGCLLLCPITDCVATGVATMKVQQNTANSGTGMTDATGASAQATSAADDDMNGKFLAIDIFRPQKRYLRVNRASATANIAYGDVTAILYKGRKAPVTQDSTQVAASTIVTSPS